MNNQMMNLLPIMALAAALLAGCRSDTQTGKEHSDIRGRVTRVLPASGGSDALRRPKGAILVEGTLQSDTGYDKATITITDSTRLYTGPGTEGETIGFGDIRVGDSVEATFTGLVRESYPVQVTGARVMIVRSR